MPKIERRIEAWAIFAAAALLLILQLIGAYRGWRILFVGLAGTALIAYLWLRSLARSLRLKQEISFGWLQVGDRLLARFALLNDSRWPALWVELTDHSTFPSQSSGRALSVQARGQVRWLREEICTRRGLFTFGPMSLRAGDPFGLFTARVEYPETIPFLVMPQVIPLPQVEVAAGGRASEGRIRRGAPEETVISTHAREFQPGDRLSRVHWPTTARRDSLHVRQFDGAPSGDWWIVLDLDRSVHVGHGDDSTLEHAVVLAASLADRGLRSGRAVGLAAADRELVWLPPQGGEAQRWRIMHALALVSHGRSPLGELLSRLKPSSAGSSLVIITPTPDPSWLESLLPLQWRGDIPTVLLLDPISFGGQGESADLQAQLVQLGVKHNLIGRDLIEESAGGWGLGP